MKNRIRFVFLLVFSFLFCVFFDVTAVKAGNCNDTVAGLRIQCNATSSISGVPSNIKNTISAYESIGINTYKYQGNGYDYNSLSSGITIDLTERGSYLSSAQQEAVKNAAKTVASAEKYISITGRLGSGGSVEDEVLAGASSVSSDMYAYIASSPGYDVNYLYAYGYNYEKVYPYNQYTNMTIIRGANSIIFQDKYNVDAYNKGYAYTYCESRFIVCWSRSDYQQKKVYNRSNSKGYYNPVTGKLTYKDLSSVQMILPGFEVRQEWPFAETINGTTYYNLNHGLNDGPYANNNELMRGVNGWDGEWWYSRGNQAFFSHLVMKYTAVVSFYYKDESASTSSVVVLKKATVPVAVYVTYEATAGKYNKVMLALNGVNSDSKHDMDSSGISSNISLVPVQYDMSMLMDPAYWNASGFRDTGETVSVIAGKVSSYQTKKFANKTIYLNTAGINEDGIDIVAMGVYQNDVMNTMTLFTSGKIYYSYDEVDFIDFSFTYQYGSEAAVDLTPYLTSYLSNAGVCEKCGIPVNSVPVKASTLTVNVDADGDYVELKVYSTTDASQIKSYPGSEFFLSAPYVSQGTGQTKASYTTSMSTSRLIIFQVLYYGASYYIAFTFDNMAPSLTSFADSNRNGKYIVVEEEADLKNLNFIANDDISSTVSQVSNKCVLTNTGSGYKYTLVISDEAGNESTYNFDVIIDGNAPTSIEGTAVLPNGNVPLSPHGGTYGEFEVDSTIPIGTSGNAPLDFIDSCLDVKLNSIASLYNLSSLEPYNAVMVDDSDTFSLDVLIKDYGVFGYTSAGMKGIYVKAWIDDDEADSVWQFMSNGVYNTIESTYNIQLSSGTNYIAIISLDYINHLYKQNGSGSNYKFDVKIYAITVYGTPYISEIIATEDGFGAIVRDDLSMFKAPGVTTMITEYVIVDATESDKSFESYSTSTLAVKTILNNASASSMVLARPVNSLLDKKVAKNKNYSNLVEYLDAFENDVGWISYSSLTLSSNLSIALRTKDLNVTNFDNQMLIRGLLLNGQAYIYARVVISTSPSPIEMFQRVMFATSYAKSNSPTLELTNSYTEENTGNLGNIFSVSGDDAVSYWQGTDMMIKYNLNMYKQSDVGARTGDDSIDIYNPDNFIIYYKSCYQSEGTFGAATVCSGDVIRYYQNADINLGKVNPNYLYKVYVGVVVALEYNVQTGAITEKYNTDSGFNVVTFASSKFMVDNDVSLNQTQLVQTFYETYYGMFLYDTSIPEVYVEYTTIYEYNPDGVNKLKDVNYAAELGEMKNFIIKVTIKYESDKYRKPAYWTRLDKNSIYWFPYYYATGRSVCGNVDRIECGYDKAFTTFGLEEALSNASTTYDPEVGLVYYLQYPTSDDIARIGAAYSVDVFDLIVKLETTNGRMNEGMDLIVDNITREQNKDFLTIYYDQDGPKILITSSPDKDSTYYAVSISAEDVSSNVAKVSFYYGKYNVENPDPEAFLLYEQDVNAKSFTGYSAKLTQKGWYTVVAEDEFGQITTYSFEVVQVGNGVMYSPTLDDTDQIEDDNDEATKVVVTLIATITTLMVVALIIALIIGIFIIYMKYGKMLRVGKKFIKKVKPIAKYTKNAGGAVGAVSQVVDAIPEEAVEEQPIEETPDEMDEAPEEEIPSEDGSDDSYYEAGEEDQFGDE